MMRRLLKEMIILGLGVLSAFVYLINPTLGVFELIPDDLPLIGNLDEAGATLILLSVLRYYGFDLARLVGKRDDPKQLPRSAALTALTARFLLAACLRLGACFVLACLIGEQFVQAHALQAIFRHHRADFVAQFAVFLEVAADHFAGAFLPAEIDARQSARRRR